MKNITKPYKPILETINSFITDFDNDENLSIISCETISDIDETRDISSFMRKGQLKNNRDSEAKKNEINFDKYQKNSMRVFEKVLNNFRERKPIFMSKKSNEILTSISLQDFKYQSEMKQKFRHENLKKNAFPEKCILQNPTLKLPKEVNILRNGCRMEPEINLRINIYLEKLVKKKECKVNFEFYKKYFFN